LNHADYQTSVEYKLRKYWWSTIAHSTMPQNQLFEIAKFFNTEIWSKRGLHTFFALNTNSCVCFKNHANIVASITYCSNSLACELFDKHSNLCFLSRGASTYTNARSLARNFKKLLGQIFILKYCIESFSINYQSCSVYVFL